MTKDDLSVELHEARVRKARQAFFDSLGGTYPLKAPAMGVLESWKRCRARGLDPIARGDQLGCASPATLKELKARNAHLLSHSRGILDNLYRQIRFSGSIVILSDSSGMLLESIGDPDFVERADRVALRPGASWAESARGTNAIGSALVEHQPIEVIGSEHFLDCNGFLSCSAAPIFDPQERLLGAIDISGDYRTHQRHTLGLVGLTSQLIEKRLFEAEFGDDFLLGFHRAEASVGTLQEGLLALSPEGRVIGANKVAREVLGLRREILHELDFEMLFDADFGGVVDLATRNPGRIGRLEDRRGDMLRVRLHVPSGRVHPTRSGPVVRPRGVTPGPAQPPHAPAAARTLDGFDTADAALRTAAQRALRIVDKGIPLLILGESGVGKEHFAKAFHHSGPRRDGPFVALNCAAIPESLFESELFGYVGGAFTGARREGHAGKFQQACGGTLFLDEIGDMPMSLQTRLLRVLQERVVVPLGGTSAVPVDFSLVCATHRRLVEAVRQGSFRQDLYFRVSGLSVTLPPLRERGDIAALVQEILAREGGPGRAVDISPEVRSLFERHPWPGNIRELQNVLRVALALLEDGAGTIGLEHLPEEYAAADVEAPAAPPVELPAERGNAPAEADLLAPRPGERLEAIELRAIEKVLADCDGNISAAARRLGISRNTLYRRLGRL